MQTLHRAEIMIQSLLFAKAGSRKRVVQRAHFTGVDSGCGFRLLSQNQVYLVAQPDRRPPVQCGTDVPKPSIQWSRTLTAVGCVYEMLGGSSRLRARTDSTAWGMRATGQPESVAFAFHAEAMACLMACGGTLIVRRNVL